MRTRTRLVYGITSGMSARQLLRGQLQWLQSRGWDVHLAVSPDELAYLAAEREGVRLEPMPMVREISLLADLRSLLGWGRALRRLRPRVVNLSTPKAALLGGIAAAAMRVPTRVYVVRGLRMEGASGLRAAVLWCAERLTIGLATDVVVVSRSLAQEAQRLRLLRPGTAFLIGAGSSNGVPADEIAACVRAVDREEMKAALGIAPGRTVVGYVGRLHRDKGVETLLAAAAAMIGDGVELTLLLVGPIEDERLHDRVSQLGPSCIGLGWTDDSWPYYAVMDILCLPTRREGFPNVILEAAAAGVPSVTTRATGASDAVVDGITGRLVEVDDVDDLVQALTALVADPSARRAMGHSARLRTQELFAPERIWTGLESIMLGHPVECVKEI